MSTHWLRQELGRTTDIAIVGNTKILKIEVEGRFEAIYCPDPSDYKVTADVVKSAHELGAKIITYADSWGNSTLEGKRYAARLGIAVMPYRSFFAYLKRKGIAFKR